MEPEQTAQVEYPRYRFWILIFLGLANTLNTLISLSLGILLPGISEDLDLSPSEQGWLGSSALIGNLILAIPVSLWLSRIRPKLVLSVVMLLSTFFIFVQGWAPIFAVLILGRLGFGLAIVARNPARVTLTAQWFPRREFLLVNGIVNATFGAAAVGGFLLTPFLLIWLDDSWRATLTVYGIVFLVVSLGWILIGRDRPTQEQNKEQPVERGSPLRSLLRYREVWILVIAVGGVALMSNSLITFLPTLLLDNHDIPLTTSGIILAVSAIVESTSSVIVALYISRRSKRDIRRPLLILFGIAAVASAAGIVLTGSIPLLFFWAVLHGIGFGHAPIIFTLPFELSGISLREIAVIVGVMEVAMRGGAAIGPVLAGFLQEATGELDVGMIVTAFFALSLFIAALTLFGKKYTPQAASQ